MKSRFAKVLTMLLIVALALGQGAMGAMAMPAMTADQMPMAGNIAGMDMSASKDSSKDCCAPSAKDKAMKASACDICCAAMAQAATLPPQYAVPAQYAVSQTYDLTDTAAVSKILPPEPPPPKA